MGHSHASDKSSHPFWWDDTPPKAAPYPKGFFTSNKAHTDIAIIGAGYTGLSAAITLARAGLRVCVLEKHLIGEGASARNGGITSGNLRFSMAQLTRLLGPHRAQAMIDEAVLARADLSRFITEEKLDCDYQPCGRIVGLNTAFSADLIKKENEQFAARYGIEPVYLTADEMADYTSSEIYNGGIFRPDIGGIHPAKLLHEMARLALEAGASILTHTALRSIKRVGAEFHLNTEQGQIHTQHLISATNGYTDAAQPWLRRRLVPVISEIIVTENLGCNQVRALMPKLTMFGESRELGFYYRPSPDGTRILLGGRRMHTKNNEAKKRLHTALSAIYPQLKDVEIDHHWPGFVVFPFDQLPKLAVHDGIIYPTGFCGSGTVWARWLGHKAACMILGKDGQSAFSDLPMRTLPFYSGRPWFLPLAMHYYRLRDWLSGS